MTEPLRGESYEAWRARAAAERDRRDSSRPGDRELDVAGACLELRRTGKLYEADRIARDEWCASVHRILAALNRGLARSAAPA